MKNLIKIFLLFIAYNSGFGQSPMEQKNELGLNVNMLLNEFIFKDENDLVPLFVPQEQFTSLTYRRHMTPAVAFRMGIGYYKDSRSDSLLLTSFFSTDARKINYIGGFIGLQRRINISKRVKPYFGLDLIYRFEKNTITHFEESTGGFEWKYDRETVDLKNSVGLGIPIGFQIYISDKISISSESYLELILEEIKNTLTETYTGGSNEDSSKSTTNSVKWNIPMAIFINYSF